MSEQHDDILYLGNEDIEYVVIELINKVEHTDWENITENDLICNLFAGICTCTRQINTYEICDNKGSFIRYNLSTHNILAIEIMQHSQKENIYFRDTVEDQAQATQILMEIMSHLDTQNILTASKTGVVVSKYTNCPAKLKSTPVVISTNKTHTKKDSVKKTQTYHTHTYSDVNTDKGATFFKRTTELPTAEALESMRFKVSEIFKGTCCKEPEEKEEISIKTEFGMTEEDVLMWTAGF